VLWQKIHDLADFVYFDHSAHVNRGVGCVSCHGRVDKMDQVYQAEPLSMSWCLDCHRHPEPHLRPLERVTDMEWQPDEEPEVLGARLRADMNIQPKTNCSTCHR
jgi:menaquinone reductase, multiheme cytochrome c subunit